MWLLRYQIKEAGKTKNSPSIQLEFTPVPKPKKDPKVVKQLDKRARGDREMVLDLIFSSFQTHEFYNFKDLVHKTSQPPVSSLTCPTLPHHCNHILSPPPELLEGNTERGVYLQYQGASQEHVAAQSRV